MYYARLWLETSLKWVMLGGMGIILAGGAIMLLADVWQSLAGHPMLYGLALGFTAILIIASLVSVRKR